MNNLIFKILSAVFVSTVFTSVASATIPTNNYDLESEEFKNEVINNVNKNKKEIIEMVDIKIDKNKKTAIYVYSVDDTKIKLQTEKKFIEMMAANLCVNKNTRFLLDDNWKFEYIYKNRTKNKKIIGDFHFSSLNCKNN